MSKNIMPEFATAEQIGDLWNVTARRIQQMSKEGKIPLSKAGLYPFRDTMRAIAKGYQDDTDDIKKEKFLKLKAERELKQDELAANRGTLMPIADVKQQVGQGVGFMFEERQRWERELPPILSGLSSVEVARILKRENDAGWRVLKQKFEAIA